MKKKIKIRRVDSSKKPEDRIGFKCDICGKELQDELVLNNEVWGNICEKAGNLPYSQSFTLLCPDCIENLLGRKVEISEFVINGSIFPINYWYLKKNKLLEKAEPYILNHARKYKYLDGFKLWKQSIEMNKDRFEDLYENILEQKLKDLI